MTDVTGDPAEQAVEGMVPPPPVVVERTGKFAFFVAAGILASRVAGLARQSVFAYFFGASSLAGDAFQAAFRIPNLLQNLFGEGVLSASFVPEYAGLRARQRTGEARDVAGGVFAVLALVISLIVLAGVLSAPWLVRVLASGFQDPAQIDLTILLVQILFPGAGLLVCSAWCLGILNSHRLFLLSYMAPLAWNAVMIGALLIFGGRESQPNLAIMLAWASVIGSAAQFVVQLPAVMRVAGRIRPRLAAMRLAGVRRVFANFGPAFVARGVVQISAFIDLTLATYLPVGAVLAMGYAQTIYLLPGSLFGMSVSAAELPVMSSAVGTADQVHEYLQHRLRRGMARIAFFVVPCVVAFWAVGDVLVAAVFERGEFDRADTLWVWGILAAATVGLLASTLGRLVVSTFYALRDTRTPLRYAVLRIVLGTGAGLILAFLVPGWLGLDSRWGAAGLAMASGLAGWVEFLLLRRALGKRIGVVHLEWKGMAYLWLAAILAAAAAYAWRLVPGLASLLLAFAVVTTFSVVYGLLAYAFNIPDARALVATFRSKLGLSRGV